jgi:hypothetical protein
MSTERECCRRPRHRWLLALAALLGMAATAIAAEGDLETKVKAAYLYHLTKFVEWPSLPADAVRICVLGSDAVGAMMGELANRQVRDRPLKIEVGAIVDPVRCQVLFIGGEEKRASDILVRVRGLGVLTVSDVENFARRGGIVGFYSEAGKIKLEINPDAARAANLRISAKLLELARIVP